MARRRVVAMSFVGMCLAWQCVVVVGKAGSYLPATITRLFAVLGAIELDVRAFVHPACVSSVYSSFPLLLDTAEVAVGLMLTTWVMMWVAANGGGPGSR